MIIVDESDSNDATNFITLKRTAPPRFSSFQNRKESFNTRLQPIYEIDDPIPPSEDYEKLSRYLQFADPTLILGSRTPLTISVNTDSNQEYSNIGGINVDDNSQHRERFSSDADLQSDSSYEPHSPNSTASSSRGTLIRNLSSEVPSNRELRLSRNYSDEDEDNNEGDDDTNNVIYLKRSGRHTKLPSYGKSKSEISLRSIVPAVTDVQSEYRSPMRESSTGEISVNSLSPISTYFESSSPSQSSPPPPPPPVSNSNTHQSASHDSEDDDDVTSTIYLKRSERHPRLASYRNLINSAMQNKSAPSTIGETKDEYEYNSPFLTTGSSSRSMVGVGNRELVTIDDDDDDLIQVTRFMKGKLREDGNYSSVQNFLNQRSHTDSFSNFPLGFSTNGLTSTHAEILLNIHGLNILKEHKIKRWYVFLSQLWHPMAIMLWIAIIIEAAIAKYIDTGILSFILLANALINYYQVFNAKKQLSSMSKTLNNTAHVKRDRQWDIMDSSLIVPGDLVYLIVGSRVPADCRINEGQIDVEQAEITGESLPVTMTTGSVCYMGSKVVRGETTATVEFTGNHT